MNNKLIFLASAAMIVQAVPVYSVQQWNFKYATTGVPSNWHNAGFWERIPSSPITPFPSSSWGIDQKALTNTLMIAVISENDVLFNPGSALQVGLSTLNVTGRTLTIRSNQLQTPSSTNPADLYGFALQGADTNNGTLNLTNSSSLLQIGDSVGSPGRALFAPFTEVNIQNGAELRNYGLINAQGTITLTSTSRLINRTGATFNLSGSTTLNNFSLIDNFGTFNISSNGSINLNNSSFLRNYAVLGITNNSTININSQATIINNGTLTNNGSLTIASGAQFNNSGLVENSGTITNQGTWTISETANIISSGTLSNQGSIINNINNFDFFSIVNSNSGTFTQNSNNLVFANGGAFSANYENGTVVIGLNATLSLIGQNTIYSSITYSSDSDLTNSETTEFEGSLFNHNGSGSFINEGTFSIKGPYQNSSSGDIINAVGANFGWIQLSSAPTSFLNSLKGVSQSNTFLGLLFS